MADRGAGDEDGHELSLVTIRRRLADLVAPESVALSLRADYRELKGALMLAYVPANARVRVRRPETAQKSASEVARLADAGIWSLEIVKSQWPLGR